MRERIAVEEVEYAWDLTAPLPTHLRELLDHGQNFSEVMHGAQLLYNLMLAELTGRDEKVDEYRTVLQGWWQGVHARDGALDRWDRQRFWQIVYLANPPAKIERHVPAFLHSREITQKESLRRALVLYRMVFGQNRQEDLVGFLATRLPDDQRQTVLELCRIDLSPPSPGLPK